MEQDECDKIVSSVLEGNRNHFALLVKRYQIQIYNLAFRMTTSTTDAADLTQEIFLKAYVYLWRYNPQKKFFTWLYTLALNTIKNHIKKNKQYKNIQYKNIQPSEINEQQFWTCQNTSQAADIDLYLSELDVETRAFIIMKYIQELSFEEISAIAGKSISAVKMRVYRGLENLREKIK